MRSYLYSEGQSKSRHGWWDALVSEDAEEACNPCHANRDHIQTHRQPPIGQIKQVKWHCVRIQEVEKSGKGNIMNNSVWSSVLLTRESIKTQFSHDTRSKWCRPFLRFIRKIRSALLANAAMVLQIFVKEQTFCKRVLRQIFGS